MPDLSFTYLEDGDSITAAGLNTMFSGVQTGINDIMSYALRPGALRTEHFNTTVMQNSGWVNFAGLAAHTVGDAGSHNYDSATYSYAAYGGDPQPNATDAAVVGTDPAGGGSYGTNNRLQLTHPSGVTLGMDQSSNIAGILCMYNVEILTVTTATPVATDRIHVITRLEFRVGGNWYVLRRSERMMGERMEASVLTGDTYTNQDMATVVLLRQSDLTDVGLAASSLVTGIRVTVSIDIGAAAASDVSLGNSRLTILPLHAEL